jgi:SAM-dependent methyltransferase
MKTPAETTYEAFSQCCLCGETINAPSLSLGRLPVCNDFRKTGPSDRATDLDIVECETCRLIQLRKTPPIDVLTPRLPWIRYREPEVHLDALAQAILSLCPQTRNVFGVGPFEQPLLSRLSARGLDVQTLNLDRARTADRYPYLESWQATLTEAYLACKAAQLGTADIVSCRYIVEHSPEPVGALVALKRLLNPEGLLLIEVPDSSKFLAARDYCFLWEEHSCYFVEETLRRLGETAGYRVLNVLRYPGALEDALVAVLQVTKPTSPAQRLSAQGSSLLFAAYRDDFTKTRDLLRTRFAEAAGPDRDRIALFGIGHHAIMFVNAFGLAEIIALAVDDDQDKAGFFPPGFRTPVVGSQRLLAAEAITNCLFAVAPHIEGKVRNKLAPLAERGVTFHSIYAALDNAITKDLA